MTRSDALVAPVVPQTAWANGALWDNEYAAVRSIPSSVRETPSHAFATLAPIRGELRGLRVLDVGAGAGRHAVFAAQRGARVHAIDVSYQACELLRARLRQHRLTDAVTVHHGAVGPDGYPDDQFDLIIDSYATCHILSATDRAAELGSLRSLLAPGGILYTASMGDEDAYYCDRLVGTADEPIAIDEVNGIAKWLQPARVAERDRAEVGPVAARTTARFVDVVGTTSCARVVHAHLITK